MCLFTDIEGMVQSKKISWEIALQKIREVKRDSVCSMTDEQIEESVSNHDLSWEKVFLIIRDADGKNPFKKMKDVLCNTITYKHVVDENESDVDLFPCNKLNQHQLLVKKELWNNLSNNAKKLIIIILEASPNDWRQGRYGKRLYSRIGKTKWRITKKNIRDLIVDIINIKPGKVDKLLNEIKIFCHEIDM
jgi:hypothetical protein